jgi:hypothetical protein
MTPSMGVFGLIAIAANNVHQQKATRQVCNHLLNERTWLHSSFFDCIN